LNDQGSENIPLFEPKDLVPTTFQSTIREFKAPAMTKLAEAQVVLQPKAKPMGPLYGARPVGLSI
jgi:hypothetical protein